MKKTTKTPERAGKHATIKATPITATIVSTIERPKRPKPLIHEKNRENLIKWNPIWLTRVLSKDRRGTEAPPAFSVFTVFFITGILNQERSQSTAHLISEPSNMHCHSHQ
jgi:hypothetical protein